MPITDTIEPRRLVFPGLARFYQRAAPYSYAFMRFATGAVLVPHGIQKIVNNSAEGLAKAISGHGLPAALAFAWLAIFAESVGAICLAIGLFTRLAALVIWVEMTVIILFFQWEFGYFWTNRGVEYALLWWLLCLAIFFRGGGEYSVDRKLGWEF
jgi:putative oxidoreductase